MQTHKLYLNSKDQWGGDDIKQAKGKIIFKKLKDKFTQKNETGSWTRKWRE